MEYQVENQKLQDILTKTVRLTAKASELGVVTATTITIPMEDLSNELAADIAADSSVAADVVLVANNLTAATVMVPSIVGLNIVLTDVAIAGADIIDLVIRLK